MTLFPYTTLFRSLHNVADALNAFDLNINYDFSNEIDKKENDDFNQVVLETGKSKETECIF